MFSNSQRGWGRGTAAQQKNESDEQPISNRDAEREGLFLLSLYDDAAVLVVLGEGLYGIAVGADGETACCNALSLQGGGYLLSTLAGIAHIDAGVARTLVGISLDGGDGGGMTLQPCCHFAYLRQLGIVAIGDGAGITRGLAQAAASGVKAAQVISERI